MAKGNWTYLDLAVALDANTYLASVVTDKGIIRCRLNGNVVFYDEDDNQTILGGVYNSVDDIVAAYRSVVD